MFVDLKPSYLIDYKDIAKGPLLGRGAFGFVFKATCRLQSLGDAAAVPVAMKMLQPVQPGPRAKDVRIVDIGNASVLYIRVFRLPSRPPYSPTRRFSASGSAIRCSMPAKRTAWPARSCPSS